jgi:hypothetical protein
MKSPSLYKVALIIVTAWILFIYQQYLHTTTHYLKTSTDQNYMEFDPIRRIPLCLNNGTIRSKYQTERFDLDRSKDDVVLESKCRKEFRQMTVGQPDHVPGLTSEDYERSIAHVGNRYRIAMFVQKLIQSTIPIVTDTNTTSNSSDSKNYMNSATQNNKNNKPVTVIVCGGSITMGHGVEPQSGRYSDALEGWLNTVYPVAIDKNDPTTTKAPNDAEYNYRNDYPNRHRVFMRGGHGANVRSDLVVVFPFVVVPWKQQKWLLLVVVSFSLTYIYLCFLVFL